MTAVAAERLGLPRWAASAAIVLGLHAAAIAILLRWHEPVEVGEPSSAIIVDLAPFVTPPSDSIEDIAPGPKQQEIEAPPPQARPEQKVEAKPDQKIESAPEPDVAVPPPEEEARPTPPQVRPVPATTAPPRAHASQTAINTWYREIVAQIARHKSYPQAARSRRETGTVQLAFSIDRDGRVISSAVTQSSGHAALDQEAIATARRAEPFPAPPADLAGAKFDFTVPVSFSIR